MHWRHRAAILGPWGLGGQSHCFVHACDLRCLRPRAPGTFLTTVFKRNPIDPQSEGALILWRHMHKVYIHCTNTVCRTTKTIEHYHTGSHPGLYIFLAGGGGGGGGGAIKCHDAMRALKKSRGRGLTHFFLTLTSWGRGRVHLHERRGGGGGVRKGHNHFQMHKIQYI